MSKEYLTAKQTLIIAPPLRGKPIRDRIAPTVNITSPVNGSTITGTINISISASDNIGVSSVNLTINGIDKGSLTTTPYVFTWNTTDIANGLYTIIATAKDAANNSSSYSITVVKNVIIVDPPVDTVPIYEMKTPPIGNQGREGACVPFAVGYGARSIDRYYKTNATEYNYSTNIFSPEFLYNQIKFGDCASGTAMQTALDFIKTNGITPWSTMPYTDSDCSTLPTVEQTNQALLYKIPGYSKILTTDSTMIKTLIRQNKAVIISICVDYAFMNATNGFIWKNTGSPLGVGHSIIIIGYNDQLKAWKIMNSFGATWGTDGFGYIEYSMFPTRTGTYCYSIN